MKKTHLGSNFSRCVYHTPMATSRTAGRVTDLRGPLARADGLADAMAGEWVRIGSRASGVVLALESATVAIALLDEGVRPGDEVRGTGGFPHIPFGPALRGRVVDPLGRPLDGQSLPSAERRPLFARAPGPCDRTPSTTPPIVAGVKLIDAFYPIRKGSIVALMGEAGTGKTDVMKTILMAQRDALCVYVAIGWERGEIDELHRSLPHATVVATPPEAPPALHVLAPFAGMAIAEPGAIVAVDELQRHGRAYREMLNEKVSEAEVFSLHARLLELAGGRFTVLAAADGTIPCTYRTVGSIADRVLLFDPARFREGIRPAIVPPRIVSKTALGCARPLARILPGFRLDLAHYLEIAPMAKGRTAFDPTTRACLRRGERIVEILKQPASTPVPLECEVASLLGARLLDVVPLADVPAFERELHRRIPESLRGMGSDRRISEEEIETLTAIAREILGQRVRVAETPSAADDSWLIYRIEQLVNHLDRPTVPPYARRKMIEEIRRILAPDEPFAVADWKAWWKVHAARSLEEIRREVRTRRPV